MRTFAWMGLCLFLGAQAAYGQAGDISKYAQMPETWSAEISPGGKEIAIGCAPNGVRGICIYSLTGAHGPRMIAVPAGANVSSFEWASDQYLLYVLRVFDTVRTGSGMLEHTVYRQISYDVETENSAILMGNMLSLSSTAGIDSFLVDDPENVLMSATIRMSDDASLGSNIRRSGEVKHAVFKVSLKTGTARLEDSLSGSVLYSVHDEKGVRYAHVERNFSKEQFSIFAYNGRKKTKIYERGDVETDPLYIKGLNAQKDALVVFFDGDGRWGLHEISLSTGEIIPFELAGQTLDGQILVDDPLTGTILGYGYTAHIDHEVYADEKLANYADTLKRSLKADSVILTSWTADHDMAVARVMKYGVPDNYFLFDATVPELSPVGSAYPAITEADVGTVIPTRYMARDGVNIPAYLTLPPGKAREDGPFPLVVMPHGGPESRDTAGYDWLAQAVASQGYVVLQPNFRGSDGYGPEFRDLGYGEFGGKMVDDIIDGAGWAVREGIASGAGYCAVGASYGAYASLMTNLRDPENKSGCVVSINGVTDPVVFMADFADGREGTFAYWTRYIGDLYTMTDAERIALAPAQRHAEFSAPLLLLHGREDTTVPVEQSERLAGGLKDRNGSRFIKIDGDDHYLTSSGSRQMVLTETLGFLGQHHPAKQ